MQFYDELGSWWHLISPPEDYAEEARFFLQQMAGVTSRPDSHLLELGSGGGNNALHMKHAFASVTLVDLSPQMLALSQQINPECEHIVGDMRTLRLNQTFDVVFIHDAIDYMTTLEELRLAMYTAYLHCQTDGIALFVPDDTVETFEASTDHGGSDGDGRAIRYLEWSNDPDPNDGLCTTDYVFVLRADGQPVRVIHETHTLGLFSQAAWLQTMQAVGFAASSVEDDYGRTVFIGHRSHPT